MSTQIPRIYSYPTVPYPYLPPPGPFPGATPRPGFVPVGFPLRSGNWLLLGVDRVTGLCEDAGGESSSSSSPKLP